MHIKINKKYLTYGENKVKCAIGKRGINFKRKEGDLITPRGNFKVINIFFRKDRIKDLKTKIKKIPIHKGIGWCDDPLSNKYNKLIRYPFKYNSEKLFRSDNIYDIILVLNYNMKPTIKNKGSAIFIHVAKKNYKKTLGCIAVSKISLLKIIKKLNRKSIVEISNQR